MKRCPFCGSEAMVHENHMWIECTNEDCKSYGPDTTTADKAIEAWDNRPIENELIEALEDCMGYLKYISPKVYSVVINKAENAISKAKGEVK